MSNLEFTVSYDRISRSLTSVELERQPFLSAIYGAVFQSGSSRRMSGNLIAQLTISRSVSRYEIRFPETIGDQEKTRRAALTLRLFGLGVFAELGFFPLRQRAYRGQLMSHPQSGTLPPPVAMLQIIQGFWVSRAVYVAAELRIPNLVQAGSKTAEELAGETGTHGPSLYRVLRALASVGVFSEDEDGRFSMTPLAATLKSDTPGSLRALAITELASDHYPAWEAVLHSVKTGEVAFHKVYGMDAWEHRAQHPEDGEIFDEGMASFGNVVDETVIESYDFSKFSKVVDVGGGNGSFLVHLLSHNPKLRGLVQDLPHVVPKAKRNLAEQGLGDRCEVVEMSFLESVASGGDAYFMKWIVHDWDDEDCTTMLKNCSRAMAPDGRLLIVEAVIPPGNTPSFSKFMDLNMMVMLGGRERTEAQYRKLLAAGGFQLTSITPTHTEMHVIEAMPTP